mmetsp:Transcript_53450/g.106311  ORF Transcript_53450/g.106311 Transcript_53450/m.106311 type:complete len:243 (-) Transcript_53450:842-1570(-)
MLRTELPLITKRWESLIALAVYGALHGEKKGFHIPTHAPERSTARKLPFIIFLLLVDCRVIDVDVLRQLGLGELGSSSVCRWLMRASASTWMLSEPLTRMNISRQSSLACMSTLFLQHACGTSSARIRVMHALSIFLKICAPSRISLCMVRSISPLRRGGMLAAPKAEPGSIPSVHDHSASTYCRSLLLTLNVSLRVLAKRRKREIFSRRLVPASSKAVTTAEVAARIRAKVMAPMNTTTEP